VLNYTLYAAKYAKPVLKNVPNMHHIMTLAKNVLKFAKNAQRFVLNGLLINLKITKTSQSTVPK